MSVSQGKSALSRAGETAGEESGTSPTSEGPKIPSVKFRLLMVLHGECEWDKKKLYTGWYDAPLSERGTHEAQAAAATIKKANLKFDIAFTSELSRSTESTRIILEETDQVDTPIRKAWQLNDRHIGALTGLTKEKALQKYEESEIDKWQDVFDERPPQIGKMHPFYDIIIRDNRYRGQIKRADFPLAESLKECMERIGLYWKKTIVPQLMMRKYVFICGHKNTLKAIIKSIEDIPDEDITNLKLPVAVPIVYELDCKFKPIGSMRFLGDEIAVQRAIDLVGSIAEPKS